MRWSSTSAEELERARTEILSLLSAALEEALDITTRADVAGCHDDLVEFIDLAGQLARSMRWLRSD